jgi:chromate transporter
LSIAAGPFDGNRPLNFQVNDSDSTRRDRLVELAKLFLKLGTIGFGGPAAHIALMEDEIVGRRRWLSHAEFLDLLGATNLIPGPNSTEMAIHIGHRRAGFPGLVVAGSCFILPAMLIVMACGWAYVRFGKLPQVQWILYAIKPVIIAVVFQALWRLGKSAVRTPLSGILAAAIIPLGLMRINELALLFGAGAIAAILQPIKRGGAKLPALGLPSWKPLLATLAPGAATTAVAAPFGLWQLFWFFLKVGSVLYGSGYVLLAFLQNGLVDRFGWMTQNQLLDAVAVGQITPGPVFTTATFIGYVLGGTPAALIATAGIFLPAFFFVAISGPLVPRIRQSPVAGAFLDGINAASLGLMAVVTLELARGALVDWLTVALAAVAALLLLFSRINSMWLIAGGAMAGLVRIFFHS